MKVVHVGPPLQRTGGPAGYLLELARAAGRFPSDEHVVLFPGPAPVATATRPRASSIRSRLRRWKRAVLGPPAFYRPGDEDIRRVGGPMAALLRQSATTAASKCRGSLELASAESPDVLFVHEIFAVRDALERRGNAQVWLFVHAPMPAALYLAWCWGRPDLSWEVVAALPDVVAGIEAELALWREVDRVVLPCPEALPEIVRIDSRFADIGTPIDYVLTGSSVGGAPGGSREERGEIQGLFLGNAQPYRGLDVLLEALRRLPDPRSLPGTLLVAGPDPESIERHPRLRALGRVGDVPGLLDSVDFVVNTNRFSLFDLSNIEAAAAGKPLLLHRVGGNLALEKLGVGCRSFSELTPEAVAEGLAAMFSTSRRDLVALGARSRACYERYLTAETMWQRHLDLYSRVGARPAEKAMTQR